MREFRTLGSVRGAGRNRTRPAKASPYRDRGLLPLRVELPAKAPQRTSRSQAMRKFKRQKDKWVRAWAWLNAIIQWEPRLFAHWGLF